MCSVGTRGGEKEGGKVGRGWRRKVRRDGVLGSRWREKGEESNGRGGGVKGEREQEPVRKEVCIKGFCLFAIISACTSCTFCSQHSAPNSRPGRLRNSWLFYFFAVASLRFCLVILLSFPDDDAEPGSDVSLSVQPKGKISEVERRQLVFCRPQLVISGASSRRGQRMFC